MKYLVVFLLAVAGVQQAQALTCRVQMISTVCGTGRVEIVIDRKMNSFQMVQGDVACWNIEYKFDGHALRVQGSHPYNLEDTFQLRIPGAFGVLEEYGMLYYDPKVNKARLEIARKVRVDLGRKYDLDCEAEVGK